MTASIQQLPILNRPVLWEHRNIWTSLRDIVAPYLPLFVILYFAPVDVNKRHLKPQHLFTCGSGHPLTLSIDDASSPLRVIRVPRWVTVSLLQGYRTPIVWLRNLESLHQLSVAYHDYSPLPSHKSELVEKSRANPRFHTLQCRCISGIDILDHFGERKERNKECRSVRGLRERFEFKKVQRNAKDSFSVSEPGPKRWGETLSITRKSIHYLHVWFTEGEAMDGFWCWALSYPMMSKSSCPRTYSLQSWKAMGKTQKANVTKFSWMQITHLRVHCMASLLGAQAHCWTVVVARWEGDIGS